MKKLLLLFGLFLAAVSFAQNPDKFEFTSEAMNPFIVTEVPGKTAAEIYESSLAWIKKNYNSPDDVIITTVENDYIRFQGVAKDVIQGNSLGMTFADDMRYTAELSVKDNRYKFELTQIEVEKENQTDQLVNIANSTNNRGQINPRKYWGDSTKYWLTNPELEKFKKNGSGYIKKDGTVRKIWKDYIHLVPEHFNTLNTELKDYILGNSPQQKDDW